MLNKSHLNKDTLNGLVEFKVSEKKDGDFKPSDSDEFKKKIEAFRKETGVSKIIAPIPGNSGKVVVFGDEELIAGPAGILRTKGAADGFIITTKDEPAAIMFATADCPVVIVLAELGGKHYALGLAHCGWKPLVEGVLDNLVLNMEKLHKDSLCGKQSSRYSIRVLITPGIGPCCFEVSEEVAHRLASRYKKAQSVRTLYRMRCYIKNKGDKILVDIPKICWCYFEERGAKDIAAMNICTKCSGQFFSHRRGDKERNFVAAYFTQQAYPLKKMSK